MQSEFSRKLSQFSKLLKENDGYAECVAIFDLYDRPCKASLITQEGFGRIEVSWQIIDEDTGECIFLKRDDAKTLKRYGFYESKVWTQAKIKVLKDNEIVYFAPRDPLSLTSENIMKV